MDGSPLANPVGPGIRSGPQVIIPLAGGKVRSYNNAKYGAWKIEMKFLNCCFNLLEYTIQLYHYQ